MDTLLEIFKNQLIEKLAEIQMENIITWLSLIVIGILFFSFYKFIKSSHDNNDVDWIDLIRVKGSDKISLTKTIQLVGATIASWVVIKLTLQGKLTWDLFSIYLLYCASTEGYSKYLSTKYGMNNQKEPLNDKEKS